MLKQTLECQKIIFPPELISRITKCGKKSVTRSEISFPGKPAPSALIQSDGITNQVGKNTVTAVVMDVPAAIIVADKDRQL